MLVLSRKEGERLVIGENVIITVTRIAGNRITLGIEAPREVRVTRGELERFDEETAAPKDRSKQRLGDRSQEACHGGDCTAASQTIELDLDTIPTRAAS